MKTKIKIKKQENKLMKTCFFGKDNSNCAYNNKTRQETCINDRKKRRMIYERSTP